MDATLYFASSSTTSFFWNGESSGQVKSTFSENRELGTQLRRSDVVALQVASPGGGSYGVIAAINRAEWNVTGPTDAATGGEWRALSS